MTIFAPLPNSTNASVLKQKDTKLALNKYSNFYSLCGIYFFGELYLWICGIHLTKQNQNMNRKFQVAEILCHKGQIWILLNSCINYLQDLFWRYAT